MLYIMNKNKLIKIKVCPWDPEGPTRVLNSLWSWLVKNLMKIKWRLGWTQNVQGSIKIPRNTAIQFKGILKDATGSKMENKFAIILSFSI